MSDAPDPKELEKRLNDLIRRVEGDELHMRSEVTRLDWSLGVERGRIARVEIEQEKRDERLVRLTLHLAAENLRRVARKEPGVIYAAALMDAADTIDPQTKTKE